MQTEARARFLIGRHAKRGLLWASIDPHARFTGSEIGETRFAGYLKPFPTEEAARDALIWAGAEHIEPETRRRARNGGQRA